MPCPCCVRASAFSRSRWMTGPQRFFMSREERDSAAFLSCSRLLLVAGPKLIARRPPGKPFRLAFVRDPGAHERMLARTGQFQRVPLRLFADHAPPGQLPRTGDLINDPRN